MDRALGHGGIEDLDLDQGTASSTTTSPAPSSSCAPHSRSWDAAARWCCSAPSTAATADNRLSGPACAVAKAGVIGLTKHLARDQAPHGIRVNRLTPGPVATAMADRLSTEEELALREPIPLDHVTTPEEIAGTVEWPRSPPAASVTGTTVDANGGMGSAESPPPSGTGHPGLVSEVDQPSTGRHAMSAPHKEHVGHEHHHGDGCGHVAVPHQGHVDYLHDGHLHREHNGHYDECETTGHSPHAEHGHQHGAGCGHPAIPHGDHVDYLHDGHRHAAHGDHYDEH
jgi:hypothetical protein